MGGLKYTKSMSFFKAPSPIQRRSRSRNNSSSNNLSTSSTISQPNARPRPTIPLSPTSSSSFTTVQQSLHSPLSPSRAPFRPDHGPTFGNSNSGSKSGSSSGSSHSRSQNHQSTHSSHSPVKRRLSSKRKSMSSPCEQKEDQKIHIRLLSSGMEAIRIKTPSPAGSPSFALGLVGQGIGSGIGSGLGVGFNNRANQGEGRLRRSRSVSSTMRNSSHGLHQLYVNSPINLPISQSSYFQNRYSKEIMEGSPPGQLQHQRSRSCSSSCSSSPSTLLKESSNDMEIDGGLTNKRIAQLRSTSVFIIENERHPIEIVLKKKKKKRRRLLEDDKVGQVYQDDDGDGDEMMK